MKVWLVQRAESTPHDNNGIRRLMRMGILAEYLSDSGHEVIWWTSAFDHMSRSRRYDSSARVPVLKSYFIHYIKCFGYKSNKSLARFVDNYFVAREFRKEIKKNNDAPNIIFASVPSIELASTAVEYGREKGIPVFLDIRDLWPDLFFDFMPKYLHWLVVGLTYPMRRSLKRACEDATGILGITDKFVQWGTQHAGRPVSSLDLVFPMAYVRKEYPAKAILEAEEFWNNLGVRSNSGNLEVLFLGSFSNSFDFDTIFLAALSLYRDKFPIRFLFCGSGEAEDYVKSRCDECKNCIFVGWVDGPQIQVALNMSAVGLAPYKELSNFVDNIPNKPAEYLSEGLIIANNMCKGALYELIEDTKCGFSYCGEVEILVRNLKRCVNNQTELKAKQLSARQLFEAQFDGRHIYKQLVNFLENNAKKGQA